MSFKNKYVISYSFSHLHSSAGTRVRILNTNYLKNDNWQIITSKLSNLTDTNVLSIPCFIDKFFKPISYKNTESKRTLKKVFNNILWPDRGIFWAMKILFFFIKKLVFKSINIKIVGVGYPFSSILCSAIIKSLFKDKVHLTAHFIDGFYLVSKDKSNPFTRRVNFFIEDFVLKNSDHIIICEDKKEEYSKIFRKHLRKTTFSPTMIGIDTKIKSEAQVKFNKDTDNHLFGGSLYSNIRNPKIILEIYKSLKESKLTIAGNLNDCEKLVKNSNHVNYIGNLSAEAFIKYIQESDFLINIDNQTSSEQSPGKIVEYMAFQKPIINYYKNSSVSKPILEKYDQKNASLNINIEESIEENIQKIKNFCTQTKNLTGELYNTPDTLKLTYELYNKEM